ncbi:hypothetical protein [Deinococcus sonorensis]|uniref:Uncharacterized protein n=2 Tax=Deinococcus sonorensis TaxID=309891 RepID=A0AAU7U7C1_9DEIO
MQTTRVFMTAALLALASASAQTVRVSDPKLPFSVSVPKTWVGVQFKDNISGLSVASAPKAGAALMRFNFIPKQGRKLVLTDEFAGFEQAVKQGGNTLKLVSSKNVSYGGVAGILRTYDMVQKKHPVRMRLWFGNGAKNFYSFQLTDTQANFSKSAPIFAAALSSLKFN